MKNSENNNFDDTQNFNSVTKVDDFQQLNKKNIKIEKIEANKNYESSMIYQQ